MAWSNGHLAPLTLIIASACSASRLKIWPSTKASGFGDSDTADLLAEVSRGIGKHLWFIESHVAPK